MQIGILTYYGVFNHGALLQANALKTVLQSLGHECAFLQFNRNYDMIPQNQVHKYNISLKSVGLYFIYLKNKGIRNTVYNLKKNRVLNLYRKTSLPICGMYTEFSGDVVVIGSDEVFSLEIGINPFLYGHSLMVDHVISYGASFGPTTLEQVEKLRCDRLIASGLSYMNAVSIRDQNSADIVQALTGKTPEIVCDPVILYGYEAEIKEYIPPVQNYILIYSYENNLNTQEEVSAIRAYAKEHGFHVYAAAYYHGWCDKNIQATPTELLGWVRHATLVITDTFHGAVLALICETPMIVRLRENRNKLAFLMEQYDLAGRVLDDFSKLHDIAEQAVDFAHVKDVMEEQKKKSLNFLKTALNGGKRRKSDDSD